MSHWGWGWGWGRGEELRAELAGGLSTPRVQAGFVCLSDIHSLNPLNNTHFN